MTQGVDTSDSYTIKGKLALPYTYFAGRVGSTFITTIRDQQKIMGVKCTTCDTVFVPPRQTCERCMETIATNWVELGTTGELVNYTVVRYDDGHLPRKAPFVLGLVKLAGADTPLVHIIDGVDPDRVEIGMTVQAVFAKESTNTILDIDCFELVPS